MHNNDQGMKGYVETLPVAVVWEPGLQPSTTAARSSDRHCDYCSAKCLVGHLLELDRGREHIAEHLGEEQSEEFLFRINEEPGVNAEAIAKHGYHATDDYLFVEQSMPREEYWKNVFLNEELLEAKWPLKVFDYIVNNCASIDKRTGYNFEGIVFRGVRNLKTESTQNEIIKRWAIPKQQVDEILDRVCKT